MKTHSLLPCLTLAASARLHHEGLPRPLHLEAWLERQHEIGIEVPHQLWYAIQAHRAHHDFMGREGWMRDSTPVGGNAEDRLTALRAIGAIEAAKHYPACSDMPRDARFTHALAIEWALAEHIRRHADLMLHPKRSGFFSFWGATPNPLTE